jgi:hypothetical protein
VSRATNDLAIHQVSVKGVVVGTAANGQTLAASGTMVVLSDGPIEVDRLTVP